MKIKKFVAQTMKEALMRVSAELGKDAVILQSRKVNEGGILGIGEKSMVEVTAAIDPSAPRQSSLHKGPVAKSQEPRSSSSQGEDKKEHLKLAALTAQVRGLEDSVKMMVHKLQYPSSPVLPEPLGRYYMQLNESGMQPETVSRVLIGVYESMGGDELSKPAIIERKIKNAIVGLIPKVKEIDKPESEPLKIALIGPTGVGKTTTIAKLAANAKLFKKMNAAMITADTFRIAAAEQLQAFADIINIRMEVVYSRSEMRKAIDIHADKDIIFIDTTGRSPKDTENISDLLGLVMAAKPHIVHLVLSSTTETTAQELAVKKFGIANIDSLIFTKVDETMKIGSIIDVASITKKPIAYITNGQNVPDDIEKWNANKFAGELIRA